MYEERLILLTSTHQKQTLSTTNKHDRNTPISYNEHCCHCHVRAQVNHFKALPEELLLLLLRGTLAVEPSAHSSLRACCKEWRSAVDSMRTSIYFSLVGLAKVAPYLAKLPSLDAVTIFCDTPKRKPRKALKCVHTSVPGLKSLSIRCDQDVTVCGMHVCNAPFVFDISCTVTLIC